MHTHSLRKMGTTYQKLLVGRRMNGHTWCSKSKSYNKSAEAELFHGNGMYANISNSWRSDSSADHNFQIIKCSYKFRNIMKWLVMFLLLQ